MWGNATFKDFRLDSGVVMDLRLGYITMGTHNGNNAVLIMHGTGDSGIDFLDDSFSGELFGAGQLLDTSKYFVILTDALGHGNSSRPSDGLRMKFPRYMYPDMVRGHHLLLSKGLGVEHARLIMGTSMGGMHSYLWGEFFPDFMDALMPICALPGEIAGRNRMQRQAVIRTFMDDPDWLGGNYKTLPMVGMTAAAYSLMWMNSAPLYWHLQAPTGAKADKMIAEQVAYELEDIDPNNLIYALNASTMYLPQPSKITATLYALNFEDDQINPPDVGALIMIPAISSMKNGKYILLPTTNNTRGHVTSQYPAMWKWHLKALLKETDEIAART